MAPPRTRFDIKTPSGAIIKNNRTTMHKHYTRPMPSNEQIADFVRAQGSATDDEINFGLCMTTQDGYRRLSIMVHQKWLTCELDEDTGLVMYKALVRHPEIKLSASVQDPFDDLTNLPYCQVQQWCKAFGSCAKLVKELNITTGKKASYSEQGLRHWMQPKRFGDKPNNAGRQDGVIPSRALSVFFKTAARCGITVTREMHEPIKLKLKEPV